MVEGGGYDTSQHSQQSLVNEVQCDSVLPDRRKSTSQRCIRIPVNGLMRRPLPSFSFIQYTYIYGYCVYTFHGLSSVMTFHLLSSSSLFRLAQLL